MKRSEMLKIITSVLKLVRAEYKNNKKDTHDDVSSLILNVIESTGILPPKVHNGYDLILSGPLTGSVEPQFKYEWEPEND